MTAALFFIFKATDKDAGKNGEVTYTLEDGNIGNTFNIDYSRYASY